MKIMLISALLFLAALPAGAAMAPLPEAFESSEFREIVARAGDDLYIAGQPTEQGLKDLAAAGVGTVVNLRTAFEMDDRSIVPFDEAALVRSLGLEYVHIPSGGPDTPYSEDMVSRFDQALRDARQNGHKVLLHCTVAWRASHLYTAWLHRMGGLSLDEAVRHGRAINLGSLPLEGFLGGELSFQVQDQVQDD
jgi:uncharacterized protein (TIGR01244 family)